MKYFGTDGFRAIFDDKFLETAYKTGYALSSVYKSFLVARDTRESGELVAKAFISGAIKNGATVSYAGILPTPALSVAVKNDFYEIGVIITASHNPKEYNGIKIFDGNGYKLSDNALKELEIKIDESPVGDYFYLPPTSKTALSTYLDSLKRIPKPKKPLKVLVDCSAGATVRTAKIFEEFGLNTVYIGTSGTINENSGVFFVDNAVKIKKEVGADLAFVFDGDGDRVICIDENNEILNGDAILYILTKYLIKQGGLKKKTVVGTVYSSVALERSLNVLGVTLVRTSVGDKYVSDTMKKFSYPLGAESSGHVIFNVTTGDGVRTALILCYLASVVPLKERKTGFMHGIVKELTYPFGEESYKKLKSYAENYKSTFGKNGRMLVRKSGTEPIIRVLLESDDESIIAKIESDLPAMQDG